MPMLVRMLVPASPSSLEAALEGLCGLNYRMMRLASLGGGGFPPLYESGIVYRREPPRQEAWQSAAQLLRTKMGDCEDVTAYRVGELRRSGEPARPVVRQTKRGSYHALVERADGTTEDPSRILLALERMSHGRSLR